MTFAWIWIPIVVSTFNKYCIRILNLRVSKQYMTENLAAMNPAVRIIRLRQGNRSLEDHIQDFLEIADFSDLPDYTLIDFFCYGLNEHYQSKLILDGPQFLDFVLLLRGFSFTFGEVEDNASPKHFLKGGSMHQVPVATELGKP